MNSEIREKCTRAWYKLKIALMSLKYHRVQKNIDGSFNTEPKCQKLFYEPDAGAVIAVINREALQESRLLSEINQAKAKAVFHAYLGQSIKVAVDEESVYFKILVTGLRNQLTTI